MNSPIESLPAADAQTGIGVRPTTPGTCQICDLLEHGFVSVSRPLAGARSARPTGCRTTRRRSVFTDGAKIVGHVGTIYSQREINGKTGICFNDSGFSCRAGLSRPRLGGNALAAAAQGDKRITYTSLTPPRRHNECWRPMGGQSSSGTCCCSLLGLDAETLWRSRVDIDVNDPTARCLARAGRAPDLR